jgi:DNA-binding HxlR family transcriptional regulator
MYRGRSAIKRNSVVHPRSEGQGKVKEEICDSVCEISRALSVVGDRWTLLIMRELTFGMRKFEEIQALTGMSSHLLSNRLKRMEEEGLLERKEYSSHPVRYEYHATAKGKGLDVVTLALRSWMLRYGHYNPGDEPAFKITYKKTGEIIDANWQPPRGSKPFTFDDVDGALSEAFAAEREARRAAFQSSKRRAKHGSSDGAFAKSKVTPAAIPATKQRSRKRQG